MNPVYQPVCTAKQSINLAKSYLQKRISNKNSYVTFHQSTPITDIYAVSSGTFKLCQKTDNSEKYIIGYAFSESSLVMAQYVSVC